MSRVREGGTRAPTERCFCCSLACAACKIICYTYVCPGCYPQPPPPRQELSVLCLGLGGAGKSTILAALAGEDTNCIVPTMGFCIKTFYGETASFTVKELGGDEKIRPYWSKYFDEYEAIIFVVDSCSNDQQLQEIKACLENCLGDSALQGLPLLLLCNKQDSSGAKTTEELTEQLKFAALCEGRLHTVKGASYRDVDGLRRAMDLLVEMCNNKEGEKLPER